MVIATTLTEADAELVGIVIERVDIVKDSSIGTTTVTVGMLHPLIHESYER